MINGPVHALQSAFSGLFTDIYNAYVIANSTGNGLNKTADYLLLEGLAPLVLATAGLAAVATIAVTLGLPIEPIIGALAILLPLIFIAALGASAQLPTFASPSINFASPTSMLTSSASVSSTFLDPGCVGTNAASQTALDATMLGAVAVIVASLLFFTGVPIVIPTVSLALGLIAMLFLVSAADPLPGTSTQQIQNALADGTIFAFLSFGADVLAFLSVANSIPSAAVLTGVSLGIDAGGLYLGESIRNNPC
jgi:hypothetical protein